MKIFYSIFKLIFSKKFDFIFFSEDKSYQKYHILLIKELHKMNFSIAYLSSNKEDVVELKNIKNFYVSSGLARMLIFLILRTKFLFLTLPDLGNNEIKKQKDNVDYYIYLPHSVHSAHKAFKKNAFDNYDIIFCAGDYHFNELRKLEEINKSKKKILPKTGYLYFDYLKRNIKINDNENFILIAPSWNYNKKNFLNNDCFELIKSLIKNNYKVIFRPHSEHYKRNKETLKKIRNEYKNNKNFIFDDSPENINAMNKSKILITDISGISIEYMFSYRRPVIYFDHYQKIHNQEFSEIKIKAMEDQIKDLFGYSVDQENKDNLNVEKLIFEAEKKFEQNLVDLDEFIGRNFVKFENSLDKHVQFLTEKINS